MEKLSLIFTRIAVAKQQFIEFLLAVTTYYKNTRFAKIDLYLLSRYWLRNPYRIARRYLQQRGDQDLYTYGETPLTTIHLIAVKAGISPDDTVLELGCGRGRTCFWLREWLGCRVVGIEQVPTFVETANQVKERFRVTGVDFVLGDYLQADWGTPTVIYLYASNLDEGTIALLAKKIASLKHPVRVISVSFPIPGLDVKRQFVLPFTWGDADVYVGRGVGQLD
jgi:SAM-dependent methyltransferase